MRSFVVIVFILFTLAPFTPVAHAANNLGDPCASDPALGGDTCDPPYRCDSNTNKCVANTSTQTPPVNNAVTQTPPFNTGPNVTLINPLGAGTKLPDLLTSILKFVVYLGSIVVVFMLIYVGFLFVVAQGKPGEIEKARKALFYTIIGALILLGAEAISQGIQATVKALGG